MATTLVHFATNREEEMDNGAVIGFTKRLNPKSPVWVRYGTADMAGSGSSSAYEIAALRVAPEQIPGVTVPESAPPVLGSGSVFEGLRLRLIENGSDLLLILHGYACSFENALSNAAELKTKWRPPDKTLEAGIFAWPADGEVTPWLAYASDRDDARASAKAVARTLERLLRYLRGLNRADWCNADMHLVVHSMGAYILRNALQAMLSNEGAKPLPRIFKNIFLMAPDEDNDTFEHPGKLARLPELAEAVHVYFARNDLALSISDVTKGNPDRLGATGPRTLTSLPHKVTLIDCSNVSETDSVKDARHQYYRKRAEVIADVRQVLAGRRPEDVSGRVWVPSRTCYRIELPTA